MFLASSGGISQHLDIPRWRVTTSSLPGPCVSGQIPASGHILAVCFHYLLQSGAESPRMCSITLFKQCYSPLCPECFFDLGSGWMLSPSDIFYLFSTSFS